MLLAAMNTWKSGLAIAATIAGAAGVAAGVVVNRQWDSVPGLNRAVLWLTAIGVLAGVLTLVATTAMWVARVRTAELQEIADQAKAQREAELRATVAKSEERANQAERRLLDAEHKLAPRHIGPEARTILVPRLKAALVVYAAFMGRKNIRLDCLPDVEVDAFASELADSFREAGWEINFFHEVYAPGLRGIALDVGANAAHIGPDGQKEIADSHPVIHLARALQDSGLSLANPAIRLHDGMDTKEITIHVGQK